MRVLVVQTFLIFKKTSNEGDVSCKIKLGAANSHMPPRAQNEIHFTTHPLCMFV